PSAGRTVAVTPDRPFYVGRTETEYLAIPDDRKLAPAHFVIECTKEACWVRDLGSRWGTSVNGDRVTTRRELKHGDTITAGESKFLVRLGRGAAAGQPRPAEASEVRPS